MSNVGDLSKESATLAKLEAMKGKELKELMKTMGGKPGVLKKAELVKEVHKLLLTKFDEKRASTTTLQVVDVKGATEVPARGKSAEMPQSRTPAKWTGRTDNIAKSKHRARNLPPLSGGTLKLLGAGEGHDNESKGVVVCTYVCRRHDK